MATEKQFHCDVKGQTNIGNALQKWHKFDDNTIMEIQFVLWAKNKWQIMSCPQSFAFHIRAPAFRGIFRKLLVKSFAQHIVYKAIDKNTL